jgi:hypothetical protein
MPANDKYAGGRNLVGQRYKLPTSENAGQRYLNSFKRKTPVDETSSTSVSLKAKPNLPFWRLVCLRVEREW